MSTVDGGAGPGLPPTPLDVDFEFLTAADGHRLRALLSAAYVRRGVEITFAGPWYVTGDGQEFDLRELAAAANTVARPDEWPLLIENHIETVYGTPDAYDEVAQLSVPELSRLVYPELVAAEQYSERSEYVQEIAPGLLAVTALDLPNNILRPPHDVFDALGGADVVWNFARYNVRGLPGTDEPAVFDADGVRFHVVTHDSYMTASWALDLGELATRVTGQPLGANGALVVVPFRHLVAFHPIVGPDVIPTLIGMANIAVSEHAQRPGAISPDVYWWRLGEWTPLTRLDDDGLELVVDPKFFELVEQLGGDIRALWR